MSEYISIIFLFIMSFILSFMSVRRDRNDLRLYVLEAKIDAILKHLGINFELQEMDRVRILAKQGHKIKAIKELRAANAGLGLKEAKDIIDKLGQYP